MKRSPLRRKRSAVRRSSRVRDDAYLAWVRRQPCAVHAAYGSAGYPWPQMLISMLACFGPIDPEHKREGVGMGQKASDRDAWPCCRTHHDERHSLTGVFTGWTRAQLRQFIAEQIIIANARYGMASPEGVIPW